jgi:hypothetical protein
MSLDVDSHVMPPDVASSERLQRLLLRVLTTSCEGVSSRQAERLDAREKTSL